MYRDGVPHKLPDTRIDYFEQVIDYQVPPEYYDDLGQFDGSVTVRRTRGELSAECHGEPANFLALNLAHDILSGEKSVEEARQTYTEIYAKKEAGGEPDYIQEFQRLCVPQWNNTEELERRKKCRGCHCNPEGYTATIACEKYPFDGRRPVCIETRLDLCGIV